MNEWLPISTAPTMERIIVAGWAPASGNVRGYWWWYEDHTDENGIPMEWPNALIWQKPPALPTNPPPAMTGNAKPQE